jgi:aminopeptidase-like protein
MKDLIEELYLTNRGFVTDDYRACLDHIDEHELPLTYHEYPSGTIVWDSWEVPQKWSVEHAYIDADGDRLLSFDDHPLHLISYSSSYEGWVKREELLEHVHTDPNDPEAIPWHFRLNYRPWDEEWGFCASQSFVESLDREEYYVSIDTRFEDDAMTVAEHHLSGEKEATVLIVAHLDHTGMANDDLSGVAGGIELMRRLDRRDDLTYSYKFLVVQEMLGSAAYLADATTPDEFVCGVFLEMLGNDNRLLLQQSFTGDSPVDRAATLALAESGVEHEVAGFREQIGNDELVLESPGFEIPTVSVSRFPYPEYHTHFDDPSIISEDRMEAAVEIVLSTLTALDEASVPERTFTGLPSLANPKHDLYLEPDEVAEEYGASPAAVRLFRNRMFRNLEGDQSTLDLAARFDLPFAFVNDYVQQLADAGLVKVTATDVFDDS